MTVSAALKPWSAGADVERLLNLVRQHLGMEVAWISTFTDGQQLVHATSGDAAAIGVSRGSGVDLEGSFCTRVMSGSLPAIVTDARRHPIARDLPLTRQLEIGSYIGVPWQGRHGRTAGMLCCVSRYPRPQLDGLLTLQFIKFVAELVSDHMDHPLMEQHRAEERLAHQVRQVLQTRAVSMAFQPVIRLSDSAVVAYEALARFDPTDFASPDKAFAAASQSGLGIDLEHLAVQRAFEQLPRVPQGCWLGVNLSAEALLCPRVQQTIRQVADQRIGVELTEHTQVTDYPQLSRAIRRLREAGVQFSIDDAGAGFASFNHILQLQPDVIKLDISLVRDVDSDQVRAALARSLVSFAADIGAALIAEGIETRDEYDRLLDLGVRYGQGFFLARPAGLPPSSGSRP